MERRLAAILAADVVGYSRLMAGDEAGTLARLKSHRKEIFEPKAAAYRGRTVKLIGDGTLMEFGSVVDAVNFAVDVQREISERNADVSDDRRIVLRIGINIGDVIIDGNDIYGDGVNVASRLEALAEPGGICVSGSVHAQVNGKVGFAFADLGEQAVKNIPGPIQVFRVLPDGPAPAPARVAGTRHRLPMIAAALVLSLICTIALIWWASWTPREEPASLELMAFPLPDKPSIAILPFTNMSGDPEQEFFADGITDDLITDLSKASGLFVIARNSVFDYKGKTVKIRRVAEELGVRYVLEGSVRRAGDQVRVNAQLIDATTGGHIWAERYDGSLDNIFAVQDTFVRKIAGALALNLSPAEQQEIGRGQTSSVEAREAFQRGWERYLRFTPEQNAKAADEFKRAIELDPEYGRAYAALGLVYLKGSAWRWAEPLKMRRYQAFQAAKRYLKEAKSRPSALAIVAASQISLYDEKYDDALAEAKRAIALDPNDPEAHIGVAWTMITTGKPEAGLEFVESAIRLNPSYPAHYVLARGVALFAMEDLNGAAAIFEKALERDPGAIELSPPLAATYARLGKREAARNALLLWKPGANQSELNNAAISYQLPFPWSPDHHEALDRLIAGVEIAALPLDVTVPKLVATLKDGRFFPRLHAVKTLGQFGPLAQGAVLALIEALNDENEAMRKEAVLSLGKIGPGARAAIPALTALKDRSDTGGQAMRAIKEITGR